MKITRKEENTSDSEEDKDEIEEISVQASISRLLSQIKDESKTKETSAKRVSVNLGEGSSVPASDPKITAQVGTERSPSLDQSKNDILSYLDKLINSVQWLVIDIRANSFNSFFLFDEI